MNVLFGRVAAAGAMVFASAAPLLAIHRPASGYSVPEIDATTGVLAVAAVLAVLAFVWERRRRAH